MALKALAASFKHLSSSLDASTSLLLGKNTQVPCLPIHSIGKAIEAIDSLIPTLPTWHFSTQDDRALILANAVIEQQSSSIRAYSTFVQAAVTKMHSVNPDPDSHHTNKETKPLFSLLFLPIMIFTLLPPSWPTGHYPLRDPQLYTALNTLVAYLLTKKQRTGTGKQQPGVKIAAGDTTSVPLQLLHLTLWSLQSLKSSEDCDVMTSLPPGFANSLCCLACEELGPYLSNQDALSARKLHWAEVSVLLSLVVQSVQRARNEADHKIRCTILLGPGVLGAAKMAKLAYCSSALQGEWGSAGVGEFLDLLLMWCGSLAAFSAKHGIGSQYPDALSQSASRGTLHVSGGGSVGSSGVNSRVSRDCSSGSSSCAAVIVNLVPRVRVSDAQLITALRRQAISHPSTLVENTNLINYMSVVVDKAHLDDLLVDIGRVAGALGIAHHCSFQALLWMNALHHRQQPHQGRQTGKQGLHDPRDNNDWNMRRSEANVKGGGFDLCSLLGCSATNWPRKEQPVSQLIGRSSPTSLLTCVSLVSTVRKHTAMFVLKLAEQRKLKQERKETEIGWGNESECMLDGIQHILSHTLRATLFCTDCGVRFCSDEGSSNSNSGGSTNSPHPPSLSTCSNRMHSMYQPARGLSPASTSQTSSQQPLLGSTLHLCLAMDRLRALLALTLTHIWGLDSSGLGEAQPAWFWNMSSYLDPFLTHIISKVTSLDGTFPKPLQEISKRMRMATAWNVHSMRTFNGRMLAGCCHLGCTNMGGCSEAALSTLLCSGCHKVRYCSVKCQKAAWLTEGHSYACGKRDCGKES